MTHWYVYESESRLPPGLGSANLGTEQNPWIGWDQIKVKVGAAGWRGGDYLHVKGAWMASSNLSVPEHQAALGSPAFIVIDDDAFVDFINRNHGIYNVRPNTIITGTGRVMRIVAQSAAQNSGYGGQWVGGRLRGIGKGSSIVQLGNTAGVKHFNVIVAGLHCTSREAPPTSSALCGGVLWWADNGESTALENVSIIDIVGENFQAHRALIYMAHNSGAVFPTTRAKNIIIEDIEHNNGGGLGVDIEVSGPDSGIDGTMLGTTDWSEGIRVQRVTVRNNYVPAGTNFGGAVFLRGFGNSTTPGWGPNLVYDINGWNLTGNAGLVDLLYGTYQGGKFRLNGMTPYSIDGGCLLLDIGCHHCKFYDIEANDLYGLPGTSYAGSIVLVLGAVTDCEVSGIRGNNVANVFAVYGTTTGRNVTVSHATVTNVQKAAMRIAASATTPNEAAMFNCAVSGPGAAVVSDNAKAWTHEDNNIFTMSQPNTNHTHGARTRTGLEFKIDPITKRPLEGSPLLNSAIFSGAVRDATGRKCRPGSAIGAYADLPYTPRAMRS